MDDFYYTKQDIIGLLRSRVDGHGGQRAFAREHNISEQYITDVLHDRREPGAKLLQALGYEKVVRYQRVKLPREVVPC